MNPNSNTVDRLVFTANLEALRAAFGDTPFVSIDDAAAYLNMSREAVLGDKGFPLKNVTQKKRVVPIARLARWLSV